jgi:hypothetical protein
MGSMRRQQEAYPPRRARRLSAWGKTIERRVGWTIARSASTWRVAGWIFSFLHVLIDAFKVSWASLCAFASLIVAGRPRHRVDSIGCVFVHRAGRRYSTRARIMARNRLLPRLLGFNIAHILVLPLGAYRASNQASTVARLEPAPRLHHPISSAPTVHWARLTRHRSLKSYLSIFNCLQSSFTCSVV